MDTVDYSGSQADPSRAPHPGAAPDADRAAGDRSALAARLALAQSAFYVATGLWPIFSPKSFQVVTGPKVDVWLVKTMGAMITAVGCALGAAGARGRVTPEIRLLAALSAAGLGGADVIYALKGRISRVYLLDAAVEAALIAGWALVEREERRAREG